jgi:hypothetical protein
MLPRDNAVMDGFSDGSHDAIEAVKNRPEHPKSAASLTGTGRHGQNAPESFFRRPIGAHLKGVVTQTPPSLQDAESDNFEFIALPSVFLLRT